MQHAAVAENNISLVETVVVTLGISQYLLSPVADDRQYFMLQQSDRYRSDQ